MLGSEQQGPGLEMGLQTVAAGLGTPARASASQCVWCDARHRQFCSPASPFSADELVAPRAEWNRPPPQHTHSDLRTSCKLCAPLTTLISALLGVAAHWLASFSDCPRKAGYLRRTTEAEGEERLGLGGADRGVSLDPRGLLVGGGLGVQGQTQEG